MTSVVDEYVPASQPELAEWMRQRSAQPPQPVSAVGGRTALHYGGALTEPHQFVSTAHLTQVIDYPARDMTITVEAGLRVDELTAVLAHERQRLPVDVAQSYRATVGGAIATNTSGPRRFGLGTLRDSLIGVSAVDASGRLYKAGGRVVKNVAGYDLCKLLIGSLGTLAIITQLTFKVKPVPEATGLLWLSLNTLEEIDQALDKLSTTATRPVAVEVLDARGAREVVAKAEIDLPHHLPVLCLGLEGTAREVQWQADTLNNELAAGPGPASRSTLVSGAQTAALWDSLVDFAVPADDPLTFRANLRPSKTIAFIQQASNAGVTLQAHAGNGIVIGHLPDGVTTAAAAKSLLGPLQASARAAGGNLTILNCEDAWKRDIPVFGDAPPADQLMRTLKAKLDPRDVFNRGRLWPAH